jgi:hypothetical protein
MKKARFFAASLFVLALCFSVSAQARRLKTATSKSSKTIQKQAQKRSSFRFRIKGRNARHGSNRFSRFRTEEFQVGDFRASCPAQSVRIRI